MLKFFRVVIFKRSNMKRVAYIFCAVLSVALAAEEVEIPKNFKLCSKLDTENYNECLREAIQDAFVKLSKGSPELDLPVLDPFYIDSNEVEYTNDLFYGKLVMKNINTYGASRVRVLKAKATASEGRHRLELELSFPRILIEGEYKAEGRFNEMKAGGKGFFNISMEGITTGCDLTGRVEDDRWIVEHFVMLPEVQNMKIYFDDLFNANTEFNNLARSFVNEYWPLFYKELLPVTAKQWDIQLSEFVNRIFSKLSYSKLFA